jgi:LPPG:FO 2-phospho-L-lactate transferase
MIVALAGGIGGAKLALGLSRVLPPERLTVVVNTGDDFRHLGLDICPDLDTVMYTLAGIANPATGWGLADETWSFMQALAKLGGDTWFQLGDRDLATHVERTRRLAAGATLSDVTAALASRLGVRHRIVPMSDQPVRTIVMAGRERHAFQDYFVRLHCAPELTGIAYEGADAAAPSPGMLAVMRGAQPAEGIIICPSNPYLSVGPMLAVPGVRKWLEQRTFPVVAVSPIVAGDAVKGPLAKILRERGEEVSPASIADYYRGLIDVLVLDEADAGYSDAVEQRGMTAAVAPTVMRDLQDRERLAARCVAIIEQRR